MNEIEQFLKRAAALRAQQARQAQQRGPQERPLQPQRAPQPARTPAPPPAAPQPRTANVVDAEVIEADEVSGADVAAYVQRHLGASQFQERASHLAERVRSSDEVFEAHLHETFEHRLGRLGPATSRAEDSTLDAEEQAAKAKSVTPNELARLIQSPQGIRNAIIVSELLNRPEHRW
jgi:hypothetical protein